MNELSLIVLMAVAGALILRGLLLKTGPLRRLVRNGRVRRARGQLIAQSARAIDDARNQPR
jgi:hypothetical protein